MSMLTELEEDTCRWMTVNFLFGLERSLSRLAEIQYDRHANSLLAGQTGGGQVYEY